MGREDVASDVFLRIELEEVGQELWRSLAWTVHVDDRHLLWRYVLFRNMPTAALSTTLRMLYASVLCFGLFDVVAVQRRASLCGKAIY